MRSSSTLSAHQMPHAGDASHSNSAEWVQFIDMGGLHFWNRRSVRPLGSHRRASRSSGSGRWMRRGTTATGTLRRVSVHVSFLLFLGDALRGEGLGIPSHLLGCHSSCCRGKSGSGECGLLPGAVRGGRHGVVGFSRLLGGERGVWECRLLSGVSSYSVTSGAGAHRTLVWTPL